MLAGLTTTAMNWLLLALTLSALFSPSLTAGSRRFKRQEDAAAAEEDVVKGQVCDFGSGSLLQTCSWTVPNGSHPEIRWKTAQGAQEFWLGGPGRDNTLKDSSGGYAYFETSHQSSNTGRYSVVVPSGLPGNGRSLSQSNNSTVVSSGGRGMSSEVLRPLISRFPLFQMSTESRKEIPVPDYSLFQSPNITDTGSQGLCLSLYYSIDGLSADSLQVILSDSKTRYNRTLSFYNDITEGEWRKSEIAYTYATIHKIILKANAKPLSNPDRAFRGYIAVDDVAFKQMEESEETCKGFCTFEAGFCTWTNQDENDDFDWKLGRGSQNIFTGPARDFSSFDNNEISGGYVYIDANYPRRPGDVALLLSPSLNPTSDNLPLCLKFAIHMFGNGVGSLRVKIRYAGGEETIPDQLLWEMSGESGNNWHVAQVPISSPVLSYQIVFEGEVGLNSLGIIAIDNIAFIEGNCPVLPQTASKGNGDCTFDENMCSWTNPNQYSKVDDFDWLRQFSLGNFEPRYDHTLRSSEGYFINLSGDNSQPQRGGTRAWIFSPEFVPQSTVPKCMTFYYYMYERTIDSAGPSLGSLRVYVKTVTDNGEEMSLIWRLNNHQAQAWKMAKVPITIGREKKAPLQNYQIIIEGIWGDGRVGTIAVDDISFFNGNCTTFPVKAAAVFGECSFDRDLCGYRNQSGKGPVNGPLSKAALERKNPNRLTVLKDTVTWKLATQNSRPANLQDHSFRAPIGYIYFDVFNQNSVQYPILRSPEFQPNEDNTPRCVSFWFTPFGRGDSTVLSVYVITMENQDATNTLTEDDDKKSGGGGGGGAGSGSASGLESKALVWRITTRKFDSAKPEWMYAQVAVVPETPYRVQFEGEASDGGFALDDITYYTGTCHTRPRQAAVGPPPETNEKTLRE